MNTDQRYLIAQYAPDPRRMETRNIGIILWAAGRAEARFLGDEEAGDLVNDLSTYRRWISYWHKQVYGKELVVPGKASIPKNDPSFVDGLLATQKGNYLLFDAGFVADPIEQGGLADATSFLFDDLVSIKKSSPVIAEPDNLAAVAARTFEEAGIADQLIAQYRVPCKVFGIEQDLVFNYAIADESTEAVFQRVQLKQQPIFSAATMFNCIVESHKVRNKHKCASLVEVDDEQRDKPSVVKALRMLRRVSEVVDLSDHKKAADQIRRIAEAA